VAYINHHSYLNQWQHVIIPVVATIFGLTCTDFSLHVSFNSSSSLCYHHHHHHILLQLLNHHHLPLLLHLHNRRHRHLVSSYATAAVAAAAAAAITTERKILQSIMCRRSINNMTGFWKQHPWH
jgi:hypothetical protein